jgi:hypothetical protein
MFKSITLSLLLAAGMLAFTGCATTAPSAGSAPATATTSATEPATTYVFGWGNQAAELNDPRGGTTRGAPVELAEHDLSPFTAIHDASTAFDRDRAAILSLAGDFKVSFHFMESVGLTPDFELNRPYHSWATEKVHLIEDRGDFISLQHTLVMFFQQEDGNVSEPMLVKHWRQDWTYEDTDLHTYRGHNIWARETPDAAARAGAWTQAVWQVDDSPRYEAIGRWTHHGNDSVWDSEPFWRPLPRREHSIRDDYAVMEGTHRIRLTSDGWLHEQRSLKRVEGEEEMNSPTYLAEEIGLNRYQRIVSPSLAAADRYWGETGFYWGEVRTAWQEAYAAHDRFRLLETVNERRLFEVHFAYAAQMQEDDSFIEEDAIIHAHETVDSFLEPQPSVP